MRIVVAGSSGLIGSALVAALRSDGHEVIRLVRRPAERPDEISWDPEAGVINSDLGQVDAAVNLAGANVGDKRWTKSYKREIRDSRVLTTDTLARALASMEVTPRVLVNGSAIGYYGDSGAAPVTEESPPGDGFLAEVVVDWEAATAPAEEAGIRVVLARTGLVVSSKGGAFGRLIAIFKYGVGGRVGSGNQYWSFISLRDEVRALQFCLEDDSLRGPVNLVAPQAVTNREVTKAIAGMLRRPAFLPVPALALKAALGEFASDILASQNVVPERLNEAGFSWLDPTIEEALSAGRDSDQTG
ncbi:MAG: TIGR01777 family oxidoreductase [Actinobacteria bacterium]|nr:TIGR01777 family oxidoreductase [Actinomycetota bacterium]